LTFFLLPHNLFPTADGTSGTHALFFILMLNCFILQLGLLLDTMESGDDDDDDDDDDGCLSSFQRN